MTEQIQIKLTEKDLKEILCRRFDLQSDTATININKLEGNQREPDYTEVTITAERTKKTDFTEAYYNK